MPNFSQSNTGANVGNAVPRQSHTPVLHESPLKDQGSRGRGRGRGRGRKRGGNSAADTVFRNAQASRSPSAKPATESLTTAAEAAAVGYSGDTQPTTPKSPAQVPTAAVAGSADPDHDRVIKMEDLVARGLVLRVDASAYRILNDTLSTGRNSITIGAALGSDKRRFNLKWLYDYPWLRFDPQTNVMLCALCKRGRRANQFAKKGSRNFKTSALVDHSTSNDHQKSLIQFGPLPKAPSSADSLLLVFNDSLWMAVSPEQRASMDPCSSSLEGNEQPASKTVPTQEDMVDVHMKAQQSASVNSYSTVDTISTIASRISATESRSDEPLSSVNQSKRPANGDQSQQHRHLDSTKSVPLPDDHRHTHSIGRIANRATKQVYSESSKQLPMSSPVIDVYRTVSGDASGSSYLDEGYAKEFEYAVHALLQAMNLNMPISSVADLYRLQIQSTSLADIGSKGYADKIRRDTAAAACGSNNDLRLAGALTHSTEAARTLQHVVSSEILSLVKDEVSQSPAFSVIIDEAPLREHNSLVAHVLLYLRYLRRDPEAAQDNGKLQVITRFWRCVHLYHDNNGRLSKRDPTSLAITLLERAKVDCSRLVCISTERTATHEDEESERKRYPQIIHWRGIYTYPNSLSPQVYEEITNRSEDFVSFAMTLMDLCLFMYSHPSSFAFLGIDFQEMLYKTLYEIFLSESSFSTRLPIALTPSIVIAITRNIAQIMATVLALSKLTAARAEHASASSATAPKSQSASVNVPDSSKTPMYRPTAVPKSPRSSLQIPLPMVDILVSSFSGPGSQKSVGRCPPADVLFERLRDYNFLGCLHFMADILTLVKPVIDVARCSNMPARAFGRLEEPSHHTLDQRLRAYVGTVKDAIESVTLIYGDEEEDSSDANHHGNHNNHNGNTGGSNSTNDNSSEEDYAGFHLNEFMQLTDKYDTACQFRTFQVSNYSRVESQSRLVELIHTVSSAILHDLHERFNSDDIATIQALSEMWDPTQFPRQPEQAASFASSQTHTLSHRFSQRPRSSPKNDPQLGSGYANPEAERQVSHIHSLVNPTAVSEEWKSFKEEVYGESVQTEQKVSPDTDPLRFPSGHIQLLYRSKLFPNGALASSRRRLRSVEGSTRGRERLVSKGAVADDRRPSNKDRTAPATRFGNLAKLATAWSVLPLAISLDLHLFRRLYERQLSRICREQAENKLQSINFDIGDTFSELIGRLSSPHIRSGKKITVYDILENSKVKTDQGVDSMDMPLPPQVELSGVTVEYFLRSIDAVTMALDHRLRLLSLGLTEAPLAVSRTPGECPKWMQNAMRGYWKLVCRPPRGLSIARTPSSHHTYKHSGKHSRASHGLGSSIAATSVSSQTSITEPAPIDTPDGGLAGHVHKPNYQFDVSTPNTGNTLVSGLPSALANGMQAIDLQTLTNNRANAISDPMGSIGNMVVGSSATNPHSSLLLSSTSSNPQIYQQLQQRLAENAAATTPGNVDSLPLLEALLSDPANAPPDSAPPALNSQLSSLQNSNVGSKRAHGLGTSTNVVTPTGDESKRMRISGGRGDSGNDLVYDYHKTLNALQQQHQGKQHERQQVPAAPSGMQPPNSARNEGEALGSAIARLASNMGFDSVASQVLAVSMSNHPSSQPLISQQHYRQQQLNSSSLSGMVGSNGENMLGTAMAAVSANNNNPAIPAQYQQHHMYTTTTPGGPSSSSHLPSFTSQPNAFHIQPVPPYPGAATSAAAVTFNQMMGPDGRNPYHQQPFGHQNQQQHPNQQQQQQQMSFDTAGQPSRIPPNAYDYSIQ
ncbi:PR domain-containing protein 11 [Coemansia sp. RSA 1285]|nr:PR domain-containing protein 11 [Coemansia sp. RSA 1285]